MRRLYKMGIVAMQLGIARAAAGVFLLTAAFMCFLPGQTMAMYDIGGSSGVVWSTDAFAVKAYPNPTEGIMYLEINLEANAPLQVRIYNLLGKVVAHFEEEDSRGGKFRIDLSEQLNGIYFAEVRTPYGLRTERIKLSR